MRRKLVWLILIPIFVAVLAGVVVEIIKLRYLVEASTQKPPLVEVSASKKPPDVLLPQPEPKLTVVPPISLAPAAEIQSPPKIAAPNQAAPQPGALASRSVTTLPPEDQPEVGQPKELSANLKKQMVDYNTREPAGTIIIDTPNTYLYLVLGNGKALRYGISAPRVGFQWSGGELITRMKEWPDWYPPEEMRQRQPYLPKFMAGGPGNPLGARALYLGNTLYRIHGTNQPSRIGQFTSSGSFAMLNEDIEDLYSHVHVGTKVIVLPDAVPPPPGFSVRSLPPYPDSEQ